MELVDIINVVLFIPFVVVFAICCLIFLVRGYKKGFWCSLLSLGATLAAVLVSLFLGKLLGWLLANSIANGLLAGSLSEAGAMAGLVESVAQGAIQAVLSFVFFGIFFFIALIVMKILAKKIHWEKIEKEPKDKKGFRFAGMGIRWLDAVIVCLAILLPFYGSISVVAPAVSGVANMAGDDSDSAAQLLKTVSEHPTVAVYQVGPASLVVESLSAVSVGGESINPVEMAEALEGTIQRFALFTQADGEERTAALAELVEYMRKNVIEKDWSYDIMCAIRQEYGKVLTQEDDPVGQQIYALTDMSGAEFKSNGVALLDFMEYALRNDFMAFYDSSDYEALSSEFYEKLGALINHSKQAITFKKLLMKEAAAKLFDDAQKSSDFIEQHISDEPTAKELQKQEGETFMRMVFEEYSELNLLEAFVRHPSIAYTDVKDLLTEEILANEYGYWTEDGPVLENSVKILAALQPKLAAYETAPLTNETFRHCASAEVKAQNGEEYFYYGAIAGGEKGIISGDEETYLFEGDEYIFQMNPDGSITMIQGTP